MKNGDHNRKRAIYLTVSIVFITVTAFLSVFAAGYKLKRLRTLHNQPALRDEIQEEEAEPKPLQWNGIEIPDRNIDWVSLKTENSDIYAYIYIPGTRVDDPVLQHPSDPAFYLSHAEDGSESAGGAVYTDVTWKGFSSYNTIICGKYLSDGTLFSTLNFYEDADFFDRSPYIFIYMPSKTYIFEIFAAYRYGEAELQSDFNTGEEFQDYVGRVFAQKDLNAHFRRDTKVRLDENARIISCTALTEDGGETEVKYVVQAVLLNGED